MKVKLMYFKSTSIIKLIGVLLIILFLAILYFILSHENRFYSLKNGEGETTISLLKISDSKYILKARIIRNKIEKQSQWILDYPVYKIDTGDVDNDGKTDILVGVIKPTRFFPEPAKRLFIFQMQDDFIRPLWLGSRVGQPLVDFRTCFLQGIKVGTIEEENNGRFLIALYEWQSFGLKFVKYLKRNIDKEEAYFLINSL